MIRPGMDECMQAAPSASFKNIRSSDATSAKGFGTRGPTFMRTAN
ncbi:hypothetical protein ACFQ0G_25350 [Streptomyces chiangmaiensis]